MDNEKPFGAFRVFWCALNKMRRKEFTLCLSYLLENLICMVSEPLNYLKRHVRDRLGDDIAHLNEVLAQFRLESVKRNVVLLNAGEVCNKVYFVVKGALQVFVIDEEGNETTRDIVTEDQWCSELMSFGQMQPALENIRTIEPCVLLSIDRPSFQKMMESVPPFDKVYRQVLEASYANSVYRINTFVAMSALQRLQWLAENKPGWLQRFSSRLLASYLGIHKDVFSRLRPKL